MPIMWRTREVLGSWMSRLGAFRTRMCRWSSGRSPSQSCSVVRSLQDAVAQLPEREIGFLLTIQKDGKKHWCAWNRCLNSIRSYNAVASLSWLDCQLAIGKVQNTKPLQSNWCGRFAQECEDWSGRVELNTFSIFFSLSSSRLYVSAFPRQLRKHAAIGRGKASETTGFQLLPEDMECFGRILWKIPRVFHLL